MLSFRFRWRVHKHTTVRTITAKLGFLFNIGANLMRDGIERVVNGLEDEKLGVFASLRDPSLQ